MALLVPHASYATSHYREKIALYSASMQSEEAEFRPSYGAAKIGRQTEALGKASFPSVAGGFEPKFEQSKVQKRSPIYDGRCYVNSALIVIQAMK